MSETLSTPEGSMRACLLLLAYLHDFGESHQLRKLCRKLFSHLKGHVRISTCPLSFSRSLTKSSAQEE